VVPAPVVTEKALDSAFLSRVGSRTCTALVWR
jgi:hypothetical protein